MKCYVTFDVKTEQYSVPVFFDNDEEVKRAYSFTINQMIGAPESVDKSLLYFKKDIQLQCIGEYDCESGSIVPCKTKTLGSLDSIYADFKNAYMTSLKEGKPVSDINAKADEIINESIDEKKAAIDEQYAENEKRNLCDWLDNIERPGQVEWLKHFVSLSYDEQVSQCARYGCSDQAEEFIKKAKEKAEELGLLQKKISLKRKKEEI